jgi:16S rRNA (uracil1498-N3)-methyltransferase
VKVPEVVMFPSLSAALERAVESQLWIADEERARRGAASAPDASPSAEERLLLTEAVSILIGPEGGWTPEERELAEEHGARALSLGPRILRAETAAVVALSAFTCGDL